MLSRAPANILSTPYTSMTLLLRAHFVFFLTLLLLPIAIQAADDATKVDFARDILPILSNKCFVCHGPDSDDEDLLRLDSFEGATADLGGYQAINPSSLSDSEILERLHDTDEPMPPKKSAKQLTPVESALLVRWVKQGGKYAKHWAFVPPVKQPPSTSNKKMDIDAYVEAALRKQGISFAPEAERSTLARRAALVLTGLPPEPQQLQAFLNDKRNDAYERFVDQLMTSPRYGEHQARYWLDAVRYGDTHGLHLDNRRGIFPYRDWVVDAFNQNMPLDDFITWQLAGDLLPHPTLPQKVATGFVRMNPTTAEGGVIPAEFQAKNNFDRTETLGTVLLGMTLTCARCHTHKFDPISHTEYYRLLAFFNNTSESPLDGNKYTYGPVLKAPQDQAAWQKWNVLAADREKLSASALAEMASAKVPAGTIDGWKASSATDQLARLADPKGPFASLKSHSPAQELTKAFAELEKSYTTTLVAQELPKPRTTQLLKRGEYNLPTGDPLQPGVPTAMGTFPAEAPRNRLGLARWLTSREHPLVSRVMINRIWQRTFGDGLVRTPEDFGLQGEQPTNPALLDYLAVELQENDWDLQHMLRIMVTSRTFKQSSAWRKDVDDPKNRLFARGPSHRLDAEVIRDLALWSSGLLNAKMGGEGFKPFQPDGLWSALAHPASNTKKYVTDKGDMLYRRSLYVYWKRTSPHPMMMIFDAPSREVSCVRRSRTSTALQSLSLLNEPQRMEASRVLAERLIHAEKDDQKRLDQLFMMLACRKPHDLERAACKKLLDTLRNRYSESEKDAIALLSPGAAPRDTKIDPVNHAAWSQLVTTVLASDIALLLY